MSDADTMTSRAVQVTLFEDRAEVTRNASVEAGVGASWVAVGGVSPYVDEGSVKVRAGGQDARVLAVRVRWRAHLERALGREAIDALEQEEKALRGAAAQAEDALRRAAGAEERALGLASRWTAGVGGVPRGARRPEALAGWRDASEALDRSAAEARAQASEARAARESAVDDVTRALVRLAQGTTETPRYEARVEVQLACATAGQVELELVYRVPAALWRPEHLVRLSGGAASVDAAGATAPLEIVTLATAWQRTGEVWDDIEVRFSTARPARAAAPPLLTDDTLTSRRKTEQERRRVEVDMREQTVTMAGLDRGARAVDDMPGVDDGGEPILLAPRGKVSIASDGRPFRVEVQRITLDAVVERVLFPEIAPVAHLRATATLVKGGPLLAGPVRIARGGSLVGRSKIDYVGKGEPFEIGLGADDGVRVRRAQTEQRDTVPVTGTQKIRRTVKVHLANLSGDRKHVLVMERIPVSEIEDVEIALLEAGGFRHDAKDGFLRREVDLAPQATETLELAYEIRAGAKVVLPV